MSRRFACSGPEFSPASIFLQHLKTLFAFEFSCNSQRDLLFGKLKKFRKSTAERISRSGTRNIRNASEFLMAFNLYRCLFSQLVANISRRFERSLNHALRSLLVASSNYFTIRKIRTRSDRRRDLTSKRNMVFEKQSSYQRRVLVVTAVSSKRKGNYNKYTSHDTAMFLSYE